MNSHCLGFRFPTMLMHGEEAETLDLLDEVVPMNLGLWCTLLGCSAAESILSQVVFSFFVNLQFELGLQSCSCSRFAFGLHISF